MFREFFTFELKYRLRQPMPYIFFLVLGLLVFGATTNEQIRIGGDTGNVHVNSPHVIMFYSVIMSLLGMLMVTAFVNTTALRDYQYQFSEIMFTNPLRKFPYLVGRFSAALLVTVLSFTGVFAGVWIGSQMSWLDASRVGPFIWQAYAAGLFWFMIPNLLFAAAVSYATSTLTRSTMASFVGSFGLLVGYGVAGDLLNDLDNEKLAMLLDPFAINTYSTLTKYWTTEERNTQAIGFDNMLLLNRLLWGGLSILLLIFTYWRFSFQERDRSKKAKKSEKFASAELTPFFAQAAPLPIVPTNIDGKARWQQFWNQVKVDFIGMVRSTPFIMITLFGLINMGFALSSTSQMYGLSLHPVTYNVIDMLRGSLYLFIVAVLTVYAGNLVWKERDAKMDEFYDALPHPDWLSYCAKYVSLVGIIGVVLLVSIGAGMLSQTLMGYTNYEFPVYLRSVMLYDWSGFAILAALAMLLQVLINNKYLAYFAFVALLIANNFAWSALDVESNMVLFGGSPNIVYSDMNRYGAFASPTHWFTLYWGLFAVLLSLVGIWFWVRGRVSSFKDRWQVAQQRIGSGKWVFVAMALCWLLTAGFVYYNTKILNKIVTTKQAEKMQADYEKTYKKYENIVHPRTVAVKYDIDIAPYERALTVNADMTLRNKSNTPISEIHFTMPSEIKSTLQIEGAKLTLNDTLLHYCIYQLATPLAANDSILVKVHSEYKACGFENQVGFLSLAQNGTFFNNYDFMPQQGYQPNNEMSGRQERKEHDLPPRPRIAPQQDPCGDVCMNHYISNNSDWVRVESIVRTAQDQIAIAPGTLAREWTEDGKRCFHYKLEDAVLNFYSFLSARYEVRRDKWNDVDVEIYYHKEHEYNIDKMVAGVKDALTYYSTHFGAYTRKQARIIEFPRYSSFAQAFPGTMPYSEGIGFIASIEEEEDIDMVYYVVAHEMAHQWWAHQVIGAQVQGCTVLSETFAQYSALMVMEKKYGREQMQKFLKYETDRYLRGRAREHEKELPLAYNENQDYIHYRKGSVAMYALREYLGEERVNGVLRSLVDSLAFDEPPYPVSMDAVRRFSAVAPDSLRYLVDDLFMHITLYDNRVTTANVQKTSDGKYEVNIEVESRKIRADSLGKESPQALNDWIDIAVFGQAEEGKKRGKTLYRKRERLSLPKTNFTLTLDERPYEAAIDPDYLLLDRVPNDNVKRVKN